MSKVFLRLPKFKHDFGERVLECVDLFVLSSNITSILFFELKSLKLPWVSDYLVFQMLVTEKEAALKTACAFQEKFRGYSSINKPVDVEEVMGTLKNLSHGKMSWGHGFTAIYGKSTFDCS